MPAETELNSDDLVGEVEINAQSNMANYQQAITVAKKLN